MNISCNRGHALGVRTVECRDLVVDGAFLVSNKSCPLEQGVQGPPVLLVSDSEVAESGQLEALRYLVGRHMAQLCLGSGRESMPYGGELGEVGRGPRWTGGQRPGGDGGVRA